MSYTTEPQIARRWTVEIDRLRARAAKLARRLPLDDAGAVELFDACLSLSESVLRDLSGATLANDGLRHQLLLLERWGIELFDQLPIACVQVSDEGEIVRANRAAAALFNTSAKHLQSRRLLPFVQDRDRFTTFLQDVAFDGTRTHEGRFALRPRERAPLAVSITVLCHPPGDDATSLWFLAPVDPSVPEVSSVSRRAPRRRAVVADGNGHPPA